MLAQIWFDNRFQTYGTEAFVFLWNIYIYICWIVSMLCEKRPNFASLEPFREWLIKSINLRTQSNLLLLGCRIKELKNSILECLVWLLWTTNTSHSLIQHTQYTPMNTHMDVVRISISLIRICPHHMMIQLYEMCIFRICGVYCMLCIYLYI